LKSVRLLPVVIFAALALLLFKGIGLVTNGGYVLTGTDAVLAAGGGESATAESGVPQEVVLEDTSPTLDDGAPTLATKAEVPAPHAASAEESHDASSGKVSAASHGENTATEGEGASSSSEGLPAPSQQSAAELPVNEFGDAVPLVKDGSGKLVPLQDAEGDNSEEALVARLSERRSELDKREADIDMRTALLEAAEKRLDERTQELAALEARVAALVDEKQAAEDAGFKAVVSMYESMKPKDAAKIFDTLGMPVLLKVARAMSPRKMSPILASMAAEPAQKLTTALAATENTDVVADAGENLSKLPQIVGQ
jgi:flagellar motility protein MotE (MotC chaperone)